MEPAPVQAHRRLYEFSLDRDLGDDLALVRHPAAGRRQLDITAVLLWFAMDHPRHGFALYGDRILGAR